MQVYNDEHLFHTGVKGMKWGKRTAYRQANHDQIRHPIHSTAAQISMLRKNPIRTLKGGTKVLDELNANVKTRVEADIQKKKKIKDYENQINSGVSKVERLFNKVTGAGKSQAKMMYNEKHDKNY